MPSVRSLILLSVLILVLSLLAAWWSLLQPPDSGGMGQDSFGTRSYGYRAIYEVLNELGIETRRQFSPPSPDPNQSTIVMINPDTALAAVEPTYLQSLLPWVEAGGRLVVSLEVDPVFEIDSRQMTIDGSDLEFPTLFEALDLPELDILTIDAETGETDTSTALTSDDMTLEEIWEAGPEEPAPPHYIEIETAGSLEDSTDSLQTLAVHGDRFATLDCEAADPIGTIDYTDADDVRHTLAAEFRRGQGTIAVIADSALFSNGLLALADNSVLAARMYSPDGEPIVVDEFYHGLGVRGNSLYLLTRPGYAALALGLLLFVCLASWRSAVFLGPPLPDHVFQRRDIGEYIKAMGRFFSRGRRTRPFLVRQLRNGVLRELCVESSLPPETHDVDLVAGAISRRDPQRAKGIIESFSEVDAALKTLPHWTESQTVITMRRLTACLSRNAYNEFANNWPKLSSGKMTSST